MSAKQTNREKIKNLEKEVGRYKYLAEAKQREVIAQKKQNESLKKLNATLARDAVVHITALLGKLDLMYVTITAKEQEQARNRKVYVENTDAGLVLSLEPIGKKAD